jgi:hypothetical protein
MGSVSQAKESAFGYRAKERHSGARIDELVSAIESPSAWNALLTRQDASDDTEDDEVIALRALEKNILAYCSKTSKRVATNV